MTTWYQQSYVQTRFSVISCCLRKLESTCRTFLDKHAYGFHDISFLPLGRALGVELSLEILSLVMVILNGTNQLFDQCHQKDIRPIKTPAVFHICEVHWACNFSMGRPSPPRVRAAYFLKHQARFPRTITKD